MRRLQKGAVSIQVIHGTCNREGGCKVVGFAGLYIGEEQKKRAILGVQFPLGSFYFNGWFLIPKPLLLNACVIFA